MGLDISLGGFAACVEQGATEEAEWLRDRFREVNRVLAANGLPPHVEPESMPDLVSRSDLGGMPYSWIHYLRRAIAYARQAPEEFAPLPEGEDPCADMRYDRELSEGTCHMICHSDVGGYYVPIDFPEPLYDHREKSPIAGMLGSSQRALCELIQVAPLLGIQVENNGIADAAIDEINTEEAGPLLIERKAWLLLFERMSHSIEHGAAVEFH